VADNTPDTYLIELATELTVAWLANPHTRASEEEVPTFLRAIHDTVSTLAAPPEIAEPTATATEYTPAVTPRRSLASKDYIISLIDGKPYKTLKRHLSGRGLTPVQYRERYGLKPDYPMVAENYAEMRRDLAKKIGLGRKPGMKAPAKSAAKTTPKPAVKPKATRTAKAAALEAPLKS
jgi:predicted transcriptional regulator